MENQELAITIPEPAVELTPDRREAMTTLARRHPATIALIEEITAQVAAESKRGIELARLALHQSFMEEVRPLAGVGIGALGLFATANLLLVTIALALGQIMAPWLAALLVSALTLAAVSAIAVRTSIRRGWRVPFASRLATRKFAERLSAST